jgi:two-component system LytT family response regulator
MMTERIRALIVDDEPLARASVRAALANFSDVDVIGDADSVPLARAAIAAQSPDVIFLDIRMPGETGLALARELASGGESPVIVFLTAFGDHAVEAFALHALDYLLKPLDDERLADALERVRVLRELEQRAAYGEALQAGIADAAAPGAKPPFLRKFSVRSVGRIDVVPIESVRWIHGAGNYLELHTFDGRTVLHRVPLGAVERRLDPKEFVRVHRSTIVRASDCASLSVAGDRTYRLQLRGGGRVAVSARYVETVRALLDGEA